MGALDDLIFGVRYLFSGTVEKAQRARLSFDADHFTLTDDPTNRWMRVALKAASTAAAPIVVLTKTIGTAYTLNEATDFHVYAAATGITITLPAAPATGRRFEVKTTGACTIAGNGKNIDGATTYATSVGECVRLHYNGTQWEKC